jgi:threonine/homoserine/homoserine lactone efflux protein
MMQALWEGITMGLLLSVMVGPVFFTLIQNSIEHGFKYAIVLALGIVLSDFVYVLITYFGISLLIQFPNFEWYLALFGGLVLTAFGISSFFKKTGDRPITGGIPVSKAKKSTAFFKGFGINGINPFVLLFWISIAGLVAIKEDYNRFDIGIYYMGILVTVFLFDLLKAFVAKQLKGFVTPRVMVLLNNMVGIALLLFSARLFWYAFTLSG